MQSGSARASRPDSLSPDENPAAMKVWTKLAPVGPASTRLRRTLFSAVQGSTSSAAAGRAASSARAVNKARLDRLIAGPPVQSHGFNKGSVPEMPRPGEHHRHPRLVGGGDHLVVALAAARLDHRRDPRPGEHVQPVAEREE